jgi:hypothetical protein
MNTLVRAAVAVAAALLGLGGFVAVQAATGPDDQQAAKRENSLAALSTVDDTASPDDTPSPDGSRSPDDSALVRQDGPAVQDDAVTPGADDPSTRTGHDALTASPTDDPDTSGSDTRGDDDPDTSGSDTPGSDTPGDDDSSGRG